MTPFTRLDAIAAALPIANVDTDKILPGRFLKTISRQGLGTALFADLRKDPGFILNRTPWQAAQILITLDNFGCGSSREHAPWALLDFGFRCIVAAGFADIFHTNCLKNGILPIVLPPADVDRLLAAATTAETARMRIDLPLQTIGFGESSLLHFEIDAGSKADLIAGLDELSTSLKLLPEVVRFEQARAEAEPWIKPVSQAAIDVLARAPSNQVGGRP